MKRAPIARDAHHYSTFDNHGQPIWVHMPPPRRRDYRQAASTVAAAILLALILVATLIAITLATDPRPAAGASDAPVRGQRYRVCRMVQPDPPTWRCAWRAQ